MGSEIPTVQWGICWPCRQHFQSPESYSKHKLLCVGVKENPDLIVKELLKPYLRPREEINSVVDTRESFNSLKRRGDHLLSVRHDQSKIHDIIKLSTSKIQAFPFHEIHQNPSVKCDSAIVQTPNRPHQKPGGGQFAESARLKSVLFSCDKCDRAFRLRIQLNHHAESHETEAIRKAALELRIRPNTKSSDEICQKPSSVPEIAAKHYLFRTRRLKENYKMPRKRQSTKTTTLKSAGNRSRKIGNTSTRNGDNVMPCILKKAKLKQYSVNGVLVSGRRYDVGQTSPTAITDRESKTQQQEENMHHWKQRWEKSEEGPVSTADVDEHSDSDPSMTLTEMSEQPESDSDSSIEQKLGDEVKPQRPIQIYSSGLNRNVIHARDPKFGSKICGARRTECRSSNKIWANLMQRRQGPDGKDVHECTNCKKIYKDRSSLKYHLLRVHDVGKCFSCSLCPRKFISSTYLKCHMVSHTKERCFPCDYCGKSFLRKQTLFRHKILSCQSRHHREEQEQNQPQGHRPVSEQVRQCDRCGKRFKYRNSFKRHLLQVHAVGQGVSCSVCSRKFALSSHLEEHMVVHTKGGWTCNNCGRQFQWKLSLNKHLKKGCHGQTLTTRIQGKLENNHEGVDKALQQVSGTGYLNGASTYRVQQLNGISPEANCGREKIIGSSRGGSKR